MLQERAGKILTGLKHSWTRPIKDCRPYRTGILVRKEKTQIRIETVTGYEVQALHLLLIKGHIQVSKFTFQGIKS